MLGLLPLLSSSELGTISDTTRRHRTTQDHSSQSP